MSFVVIGSQAKLCKSFLSKMNYYQMEQSGLHLVTTGMHSVRNSRIRAQQKWTSGWTFQLKVLQAVAFQVLCAALDDWAMLTSHLLWHLLKNNLHGLLHLSDIQILLELHPLELHLKNMQGFQTTILTLVHWEVLFSCQGIPVPLRHLCTLNCTQITIFHALREMGLSAFTHYHSLLAL